MKASRRLAIVAMFAAFAQLAWAQKAPDNASPSALPAEAFFKPDPVGPIHLSPSGRYLAVREMNTEGTRQLKIVDLDGKEKPYIVAKFSKLNVGWFEWLGDDWLLFDTYDELDNGRRRSGRGLGAVTRDGKRMRELIQKSSAHDFSFAADKALPPNHYLLGFGAPGTNEVIVAEPHFDATRGELTHTTLKVLNVSTGGTRSPFKDQPEPPERMEDWTLDQIGRPRVAYKYDKQDMIVYWSDPATRTWRQIAKFDLLRPEFYPAYVDEKDQLFVEVISARTNLAEIRKFNFATGKPEQEAVLALPGFDASAAPITDQGSNKVHGLRTLTDALSVAWFSPVMANIQKKADALLPGRVNHLMCGPCAAPKNVLIHSFADNTPGDYLLYRVAEDKFERIAEVRPGHQSSQMANMELYRTKTRDGADLPVWVTKTEGKSQGPRPAVVLVHGGPWSRGSSWEWNPETQFLASRGYVVIEPEFRGSTGYGDKHYRDGWKQWGQRMQDDVNDALKFAVDKGWVDANKVCIAGGSYGGYSTLIGLARDPGLYKCGVAWVAVTDPRLMYTVHWSDTSERSRQYSMPQTVGDLEKDASMLKAIAPIEHAAKIKAPLMLAYGAKDWRVPIVHGQKMREALIASGNQPEWVVYDDEGHGWSRTRNRIDFWQRVDQFLARHLK